MKLNVNNVKRGLLAYFEPELQEKGIVPSAENCGDVFLCRKGSAYYLYFEIFHSEDAPLFLMWNPAKNERFMLNAWEDDYVEVSPQRLHDKVVENGDFLEFTVRKIVGELRYYLDYRSSVVVFPQSREEALKRAEAVLLTSDSENHWDWAWRKKQEIIPIFYAKNVPGYFVFFDRAAGYSGGGIFVYSVCMEVFDCKEGLITPLVEPQSLECGKGQKYYAYFNGDSFVFRKTKKLTWTDALHIFSKETFADTFCSYDGKCKILFRNVDGGVFWLVGQTEDRKNYALIDAENGNPRIVDYMGLDDSYVIIDANDDFFA